VYCQKCGKEIFGDEVRFCANCGALVVATSAASVVADSGAPVLILKPQFNAGLICLSYLPLYLFLTVFGAFFGGIFMGVIMGEHHEPFSEFSLKLLGVTDLELPAWFPFIFLGVIFFFGVILLTPVYYQKNYARTEYRFYGSKVDYSEGFFNIHEKSIDYQKIVEVNLSKNIFQRQRGLGTIVLLTAATMESNTNHSGIRVSDINNPDEIYQQVKKLVLGAKTA
jgi:membrane protein YdbS with pleckstrin-like domain